MFKTINGGKLPERATKYSAGFDVFANEDVIIRAGETVLVGLGIAIYTSEYPILCPENLDMPNFDMLMEGYYFELHPRSSLRAKGLGGGVGIIDIDFRDEIKMVISMLYNEHYPRIGGYKIKKGDKIGQLILKRHEGYLMPPEYTKYEERNGGFGSTGAL